MKLFQYLTLRATYFDFRSLMLINCVIATIGCISFLQVARNFRCRSHIGDLTIPLVLINLAAGAFGYDVLIAQGRQLADAVPSIGVTDVTYYRWRNEYGGLKGDQVKRLTELEIENNRLRRAVSDLTLDKLILAEAAQGNF